jgi:hypothetical protein
MPASTLAAPLIELLDLAHPPVAITFSTEPTASGGERFAAQPAGCCFWEPAGRRMMVRSRGIMHPIRASQPAGAQPEDHGCLGEERVGRR